MNNQTAFFEDLSRSLDTWLEGATTAMTDPSASLVWASHPDAFRLLASHVASPDLRAALRMALHEVLQGQLHSVLVTFDGGSKLAEQTRLTITDSDGGEFAEGLHELFYSHLAATNRLA